jgi:hypothetical protein
MIDNCDEESVAEDVVDTQAFSSVGFRSDVRYIANVIKSHETLISPDNMLQIAQRIHPSQYCKSNNLSHFTYSRACHLRHAVC